ncbi:MAG: hypothetical protein OK422_04720 [Thaumarchaeota archaeon]|nr:hypothetical protein [Nitrososphaerota archaeon]
MSANETRRDELLEELGLDMKALVLLHQAETDLRLRIQDKLLDSHDEQIRRFVDLLQRRKKPPAARSFAMAIGELILASFLLLAGTVAIMPTLIGVNTPQALVDYFAQTVYSSLGRSPFAQYTSLIEFAFSLLLLLAAFYTLRQAAKDLKEMGLAVETREG